MGQQYEGAYSQHVQILRLAQVKSGMFAFSGFHDVNCNICRSNDAVLLGIRDAFSSRIAQKWPFDGFRVVKCRRCGLIYVNPMPKFDLKELQNWYSWYSSCYAAEFEGPKSVALETAMAGAVLEQIERHVSPSRILDIGCADGLFLSVARERGWYPVGAEVAPSMAAYARDVRGLHVFSGVVEDAGFQNRSFDAVHLHHVLEHLSDPSATLATAFALLRPGGVLSLGVPNEETLLKRVGHLYFKCKRDRWTTYLKPPIHLYGFSAQTLRAMLISTGFHIVQITGSYLGDPAFKPYSMFPETDFTFSTSGHFVALAQQLLGAVEKRLRIPEVLFALALR